MQSIIVTGAASGIGREIALQLAAFGGLAYTVGGRVMDYIIRLVSELSASSLHRSQTAYAHGCFAVGGPGRAGPFADGKLTR